MHFGMCLLIQYFCPRSRDYRILQRCWLDIYWNKRLQYFVQSLLRDVSDGEELAQLVFIVHGVAVYANNFLLSSLLVLSVPYENLENASLFELLLLARSKVRNHLLRDREL